MGNSIYFSKLGKYVTLDVHTTKTAVRQEGVKSINQHILCLQRARNFPNEESILMNSYDQFVCESHELRDANLGKKLCFFLQFMNLANAFVDETQMHITMNTVSFLCNCQINFDKTKESWC